jgi:hypothetical protein
MIRHRKVNNMPTKDQMFPNRFLKAPDLKGQPTAVEIESAQLETLKNAQGQEQTKLVLSFVGKTKVLPLNQVNWDSMVDITGEGDSDNWPGWKIEIYPTKTQMSGKTVDCVRIRAPAQGELATMKSVKKKGQQTASPAEEMVDEIPF